MSRSAIKAINWAALAERIPESEKHMFASFKAKSDQFSRRMAANPESPPKIDWAYYKKNITTPNLVEKFEKEYKALSVPYPVDKYTSKIETEAKEIAAQVNEFARQADEMIKKYQQDIETIKGLLPFEEMTMEDYKDIYPDRAFDVENPTIWPHTPETQPSAQPVKTDKDH